MDPYTSTLEDVEYLGCNLATFKQILCQKNISRRTESKSTTYLSETPFSALVTLNKIPK